MLPKLDYSNKQTKSSISLKNNQWDRVSEGSRTGLILALQMADLFALTESELWIGLPATGCINLLWPNLGLNYKLKKQLCVWMFCLLVYKFTHVCKAHRGQKRTLEPLELWLWMAVRCHVGAGKRRPVLRKRKSSRCLNYCCLFSPSTNILVIYSQQTELSLRKHMKETHGS